MVPGDGESQLEEALREAEEAVRSRDDLMALVAHDLRNPLGVILMAVAKLADPRTPPERVQAAAERIRRQAERMSRLATDLADFSNIQSGKLVLESRRHHVVDIVERSIKAIAPTATELGVRIDTEVDPELAEIECDGDRIVQALSNLIKNGVQVSSPEHPVVVSVTRAEDGVTFHVRDRGPGIDAAELPRMFERRARGKRPDRKGVGLGLSIVRGIVAAHGGRVWIDSTLGEGSTFHFSLRAAP